MAPILNHLAKRSNGCWERDIFSLEMGFMRGNLRRRKIQILIQRKIFDIHINDSRMKRYFSLYENTFD